MCSPLYSGRNNSERSNLRASFQTLHVSELEGYSVMSEQCFSTLIHQTGHPIV